MAGQPVDAAELRRSLLTSAAWLVAVVATSGSLYFSEVLYFVPCMLCWWQRIFMYPLVVVLGVGLLRRDAQVWKTALPLSLIGLSISVYHYLMEQAVIPPIACVGGVPCTHKYIDWFGFITIPFMAGTAFLLISAALVMLALASRKAPSGPAR